MCPPNETGEEPFDLPRAVRTIAAQVAAIFQTLPGLVETMREVVLQQREHERRIIRLEGIVETWRLEREQQERESPHG
jgi:hypothetical protein